MYAAKIKLGRSVECYEGESAIEIFSKTEWNMNYGCILTMGRQMETKSRQKELDKLEAFLKKYMDETLTMDDLAALEVHLSSGDIVCLGVAEGKEAIAALKAR